MHHATSSQLPLAVPLQRMVLAAGERGKGRSRQNSDLRREMHAGPTAMLSLSPSLTTNLSIGDGSARDDHHFIEELARRMPSRKVTVKRS
jgi:hypothetical protein